MTPSAHTHPKSQITDFNHTHTKSEITDFPSTMTPSAHTHPKSQITDLGNATTSNPGLLSSEDKTKLDNMTNDTGWIDVPLNSNWNSSRRLQVRRIGNIVFVEGRVQPKSGGDKLTGLGDTRTIATLPTQFCPRRLLDTPQKAGSRVFYALYVQTTGELDIGKFSDQGSSNYELNSTLNLDISLMYLV
ncbi:MAG: hypothetical protein IJI96_02780 [Methanobrevibacter sp.]|nr:hypothetical protein [Methanobrevibacter sp.]MBQ6627432.1 hypothetical protein [Methanobrevibacter sp.]